MQVVIISKRKHSDFYAIFQKFHIIKRIVFTNSSITNDSLEILVFNYRENILDN
jgi:hypothetical protein